MNRLLGLALVGSMIAGCFVVTEAPGGTDDGTSGGRGASSGNSSNAPSGACSSTGLPATVQAMLTSRCQGCHGSNPSSPMSLLSHSDLIAAAPSDSTRTVAALVLERIESATQPMPPGDGVSVPRTEIDAFRTWLEAGTPREECESSDGGDAGTTKPRTVCTSERSWATEGNGKKGRRMNPGKACIACHEREEDDPVVLLGGTVYPTLHEPDLCFGADSSDARVVITQADGSEISLSLTDTGNFSISAEDQDSLRFPIRARVEWQGRTRAMSTPQHSADCNSCHTENGVHGAPGRITLP